MPDHRPGGEFTVGVEEELMLVDREGHLLGALGADVLPSLIAGEVDGGVISGEVYADQGELNTPVCRGADDVVQSLRRLRRRVVGSGIPVMATGVHPTAPLGSARLTTSPRYDAIGDPQVLSPHDGAAAAAVLGRLRLSPSDADGSG